MSHEIDEAQKARIKMAVANYLAGLVSELKDWDPEELVRFKEMFKQENIPNKESNPCWGYLEANKIRWIEDEHFVDDDGVATGRMHLHPRFQAVIGCEKILVTRFKGETNVFCIRDGQIIRSGVFNDSTKRVTWLTIPIDQGRS